MKFNKSQIALATVALLICFVAIAFSSFRGNYHSTVGQQQEWSPGTGATCVDLRSGNVSIKVKYPSSFVISADEGLLVIDGPRKQSGIDEIASQFSALQIWTDYTPMSGAFSLQELIANPDNGDSWATSSFNGHPAVYEGGEYAVTYEVPIGNRTIRIMYATSTLADYAVPQVERMLQRIEFTTTTENLDHYKDRAENCAE